MADSNIIPNIDSHAQRDLYLQHDIERFPSNLDFLKRTKAWLGEKRTFPAFQDGGSITDIEGEE